MTRLTNALSQPVWRRTILGAWLGLVLLMSACADVGYVGSGSGAPNADRESYTITVWTGHVDYAGTDASIYVALFGPAGGTEPLLLRSNDTGAFEEGHRDQVKVLGRGIGAANVDGIQIWRMRDSNDNPGWYLDTIEVTTDSSGESQRFTCRCWFATDAHPSTLSWYLTTRGKPVPTPVPAADPYTAVPEPAAYTVTVKTGDVDYAGTDASVHVSLVGSDGTTAPTLLDDPDPDYSDFEQNDRHDYRFGGLRVSSDSVDGLNIWHDNDDSDNPGWFLEYVEVRIDGGGARHFGCDCWLAADATPPALGYQLRVGANPVPMVRGGGDSQCPTTGYSDILLERTPKLNRFGQVLYQGSLLQIGHTATLLSIKNLDAARTIFLQGMAAPPAGVPINPAAEVDVAKAYGTHPPIPPLQIEATVQALAGDGPSDPASVPIRVTYQCT